MDNIPHALYMAFAFFVFILAFSYGLYMLNNLNTTAEVLVYRIDETNYYDSLSLNEWISDSDGDTYKVVGIDSIIPTLYRYYKESFCVKILDSNGNLLQMFDTTIEGEVYTASSLGEGQRTDKQKAIMSLYDDESKSCYMYGASWIGDLYEDAKERIDMYIYGGKGYINNVLVDYSKQYKVGNDYQYIYLNYYKDCSFIEIFSQYSYEGDTLTVEETDDGVAYETITGTKQASTKIVITYQLIN